MINKPRVFKYKIFRKIFRLKQIDELTNYKSGLKWLLNEAVLVRSATDLGKPIRTVGN